MTKRVTRHIRGTLALISPKRSSEYYTHHAHTREKQCLTILVLNTSVISKLSRLISKLSRLRRGKLENLLCILSGNHLLPSNPQLSPCAEITQNPAERVKSNASRNRSTNNTPGRSIIDRRQIPHESLTPKMSHSA